MKNILSIGEAMIELAGTTPNLALGFAGDTFNTAWHLRRKLPRLDWNVAFYTATGTDVYSREFRTFANDSGVDLLGSPELSDHQLGLYLIQQEHGDRRFSYWRRNSAATHLADDKSLLWSSLSGADVIFFSGVTLAILSPMKRLLFLQSVARARDGGAKIVFDPNIRRNLWISRRQMRASITGAAAIADIVLPSFADEYAHFNDRTPNECARRYSNAGSREVVVKNGGEPIHVALEGAFETYAPVKIVECVDATGAGDAFNAGYLAARLNGETVGNAVHAGHLLASKTIMHHGALG
ncbi:sugar kinase [Rhizobium sp. LjRoot98]|uniref:sugar kinase n=1 Tax=Rhizobium sp. LjRoot98 TaxID=3342345 RepID=UPI003ECDA2D8